MLTKRTSHVVKSQRRYAQLCQQIVSHAGHTRSAATVECCYRGKVWTVERRSRCGSIRIQLFYVLPVALASSECSTRPWHGSPTQHASLPVHIHAALPRSNLLLPPLSSSLLSFLGLNLILAAAKHLRLKLSDWSGSVRWHLLLFLSSVTSRMKEDRHEARKREREMQRERDAEDRQF